MSQNRKLSYKWLGPYRVRKAIPEKGTYILEEFDGTQLTSTYAGNRLKKFVKRNRFYVLVTMDSKGSESSKCSRDEASKPMGTEDEDEVQEESMEPKLEVLGRGRRVRKARRFFDELGEE